MTTACTENITTYKIINLYYYHALIYSWAVLIDYYQLMPISADYYVHVLLDSFSPQFFLYYKSNSGINLIQQTATIWQCYVVLSAQLFFL